MIPVFCPAGQGQFNVVAPTSPITGYRAWYNPTTIQQAASIVTAWNDASANAFHFGTAVNSPAYTASAINGLAGVTFTAASLEKLTGSTNMSSLVSAAAYTIYAVYKLTSFSGNNGTDISTCAGLYSDAGGIMSQGPESATQSYIVAGHYTGSAFVTAGNSGATSTGITIITETYYDGSSIFFRFNGSDKSSVVAANAGSFGTIQSGQSASSGKYFDGSICEMLFYNTTLSSANRTSNRLYLGAKYAGTG